MLIKDLMTRDVVLCRPDDTIQEAAKAMRDGNFGFLPVMDEGRLIGTITDRDLAVRAIAAGREPESRVSEFMTSDVIYCHAEDAVEKAVETMSRHRICRLPIIAADGRLVGVLTLGDVATRASRRG